MTFDFFREFPLYVTMIASLYVYYKTGWFQTIFLFWFLYFGYIIQYNRFDKEISSKGVQ